MRTRPILVLACAFTVGILTALYSTWIPVAAWGLILLAVLYPYLHRRRIGKLLLYLICMFLSLLAGYLRTESRIHFRESYTALLTDGSVTTIQGRVSKIEYKNASYRYTLTSAYFLAEDRAVACEDLLVYLDEDTYAYGQTLVIEGEVACFPCARNEGSFDMERFYRSQGYAAAFYPSQVTEAYGKENRILQGLYRFRLRARDVMTEYLGDKYGGVLAAMLLGDRSELNSELQDLYQASGIAHILAISGLHVSLLGMSLFRFLKKRGLPMWISVGICSVFLLLYAGMTGAGVSTLRAMVMLILSMVACAVIRPSDTLTSLAVAVMGILFANPFYLQYTGFLFSVTAVLAVAIPGREWTLLSRAIHKTPQGRWQNKIADLRENLLVSAAIWITTLPLVASSYYEIPTYAILLNMLLLPLMSYVIGLGAAGTLLGMCLGKVCLICFFPVRVILTLYEWVASLDVNLPGARLTVGAPGMVRILLFYGILILSLLPIELILIRSGEDKASKALLTLPAIGILGLFLLLVCRGQMSACLVQLDVGQGDGTFLSTGEGHYVFVDGGSTDISSVGTYRILPFLQYHGIDHMDTWILTHLDADHYSGFLELAESGYDIEELVVSDCVTAYDKWEDIETVCEEQGIPIHFMEVGETISYDDLTLTVLAPLHAYGDTNEESLVCHVSLGGFTAFLGGDLPSEVEAELAATYRLPAVTYYKACHHGSNYSNSTVLLSELKPKVIGVSCGIDNSYGHPGADAVSRMEETGACICYTMELGQITIEVESDSCLVTQFLEEKRETVIEYQYENH